MKKGSSILFGLTLLLSLSMPILLNKEVKTSAVSAKNGDIVEKTITISDFSSTFTTSVVETKIEDEAGAKYSVFAKRGNNIPGTLNLTVEKYNSFVFGKCDGTQKSGFIVTKTAGYAKHIKIHVSNILRGMSGTLAAFGSDESYETIPSTNSVLDDEQYAPVEVAADTDIDFDFDEGYKYVGIVANTTNSIYIKSITITWELNDFSGEEEEEKDDIEWNLEDDELVLEYQDVFQVECTTKGTGESTGGEVIWETGDPLVATVDQDGTVTATGGGYTTITATYGDIYIEGDVWVYEEFNCPTITRSITGSSNTIFRLDDETELHEGDIIMIVCESENKVMGSVENDDGAGIALDATIADHKLTDYDEENVCYFYVSGNATDGFIFTSNEGQAISYSSTYGLEANGSKYRWSVSIANGVAVLKNVGVQANNIVVQYDSSEEAFVTVPTTKETISIYKVDVTKEVTFEITDRYGSYRSPALKFAHLFLNEMHALCEGKSDKQTLEAKWNELLSSATFGTYEINDFSLMLFENANAVLEEDGGDTIQQAMALYDYLLSTYNFANDPFNRVPKSNSNRLVVANANEVMIIVSVLLISTLAAAFLFRYLKGKKINY